MCQYRHTGLLLLGVGGRERLHPKNTAVSESNDISKFGWKIAITPGAQKSSDFSTTSFRDFQTRYFILKHTLLKFLFVKKGSAQILVSAEKSSAKVREGCSPPRLVRLVRYSSSPPKTYQNLRNSEPFGYRPANFYPKACPNAQYSEISGLRIRDNKGQ